jgi:hypothetical protein
LSPNKAAEIAKLIGDYVKAYQTAELDDRVALSANESARAPRCMVRWRQRVLFLGLALRLNEPHFVGGPFWVISAVLTVGRHFRSTPINRHSQVRRNVSNVPIAVIPASRPNDAQTALNFPSKPLVALTQRVSPSLTR